MDTLTPTTDGHFAASVTIQRKAIIHDEARAVSIKLSPKDGEVVRKALIAMGANKQKDSA